MAGKMNIKHSWQPPTTDVHPCYKEAHPDMTFRQCNDEVRQHFGMESWVPVEHIPFDPETGKGDPSTPRSDGRVWRGDLFLCMMPKKFKKEREAFYRRENDARVGAIRKETEAAGAAAKLRKMPGFNQEVEMIGTKEDLAPMDPGYIDSVVGLHEDAANARADAGLDDLLPDIDDDD